MSRLRILLATDNRKTAAKIFSYLDDYGFDIQIAEYDGETLRGTPRLAPHAILFYFSDYVEKAPSICSVLQSHFHPLKPSTIVALSRPTKIDLSLFDSVVHPPSHPAQLATRVNSIVRLQIMDREITRRIDTISEDFDSVHTPPQCRSRETAPCAIHRQTDT